MGTKVFSCLMMHKQQTLACKFKKDVGEIIIPSSLLYLALFLVWTSKHWAVLVTVTPNCLHVNNTMAKKYYNRTDSK